MSALAASAVRGPAAAACDACRFAILAVQLGLLLVVYRVFRVEGPAFFWLSVCCFAGFAVHYAIPFAWKKPAFVAISLASALAIATQVDPMRLRGLAGVGDAALALAVIVAVGLLLYGCLRLPIPFAGRVVLVLAIGAVLMAARRYHLVLADWHWRVVGAIFMFRTILYAYEVRVGRKPESLSDFLCYFFLLPNFYFVLFPVVDYATFKKGYYAEDIHRTAQRGILLMVRGATQLILYQLVYYDVVISPYEVHSFWTLLQFVFPAYWLYLRVSGQFHIITGMIHLFGFRLPDTNRKYFLAESFADFWRRINIYWKDFMVKAFYYPTYFRLRKVNETLALTVATVVVFVATCLLHGYQWFWLRGTFEVNQADVVFWTVLGVAVLITVLRQARAGRPRPQSRAATLALRVVKTVGVYVFISVLWSMWSSCTFIGQWLETVMYWK